MQSAAVSRTACADVVLPVLQSLYVVHFAGTEVLWTLDHKDTAVYTMLAKMPCNPACTVWCTHSMLQLLSLQLCKLCRNLHAAQRNFYCSQGWLQQTAI